MNDNFDYCGECGGEIPEECTGSCEDTITGVERQRDQLRAEVERLREACHNLCPACAERLTARAAIEKATTNDGRG